MCLGAVSVHLNWRNPADTTLTLVGDLKPVLLVGAAPFKALTQRAHRAHGTKTALLESLAQPGGGGALPFAPLAADAADAARAAALRVADSAVAAVFFTGGTTGTPKAVPHTHRGLLWQAERTRRAFPAPFAAGVPHAATVCFTPYFHVMGYVANFVFNLHVRCRAALLASHDTPLTPALVLAATEQLRPSCVNTVPWVVEGLVALLQAGDGRAAAALSSLDLLTYGGAALAPHCAPALRAAGVVVVCTYGQTELGGPVMFGVAGGDPNALQPFEGVRYELLEPDEEGVGELVLLGNESATAGYVPL
eukprot:145099-Prymnesium_polylepis.1